MAKEPYLVTIDIGSNSIKLAVAKDSVDEQNKGHEKGVGENC